MSDYNLASGLKLAYCQYVLQPERVLSGLLPLMINLHTIEVIVQTEVLLEEDDYKEVAIPLHTSYPSLRRVGVRSGRFQVEGVCEWKGNVSTWDGYPTDIEDLWAEYVKSKT
jgi:hypothetical protein